MMVAVEDKKTYHDRKVQLFKKGREEGKLSWDYVLKMLDPRCFTREEKFKFQFTCKHLQIEIEE